jgi:hypothetical protein
MIVATPKVVRTCEAALRLPIDDLHPWPQNPRTLNPEARGSIRRSILKMGLYQPLIVWRDPTTARWHVVGGNQRLSVLKDLAREGFAIDNGVPCIEAKGSRDLVARIVIRDNVHDGEWSASALASFVSGMEAATVGGATLSKHEGLDLAGFSLQELDRLCGSTAPSTRREPRIETEKQQRSFKVTFDGQDGVDVREWLKASKLGDAATLIEAMKHYLAKLSAAAKLTR